MNFIYLNHIYHIYLNHGMVATNKCKKIVAFKDATYAVVKP